MGIETPWGAKRTTRCVDISYWKSTSLSHFHIPFTVSPILLTTTLCTTSSIFPPSNDCNIGCSPSRMGICSVAKETLVQWGFVTALSLTSLSTLSRYQNVGIS